ncbi:DUF1146 family protein [Salirhabdus salicampi]|uniref:DUF1146 family protein n=1 Tax=Salirhabdus salicampi TaxID=476102 RepID=UPI0020C41AFD|nr:DUF1146 family protein [Salirhabdus salicampi]MCP8617459.1 DUF1146 family protein [Salirhabdus salicampi]
MLQSLGIHALTGIMSHIFFIIVTWWVLQSVRFDVIFKKGHTVQANLLFILVTVAIGTTVSRFFLEFLRWSQELIYLF